LLIARGRLVWLSAIRRVMCDGVGFYRFRSIKT
jgi:hypothetical protein